jgi:hypothetical protein
MKMKAKTKRKAATKPGPATYWTVVLPRSRKPVLPYDCNDNDDQGMLVYRSEEAAKASCRHRYDLYSIRCKPCRLGEEVPHE